MIVSDEPEKTGAMGFYRFGKEEIHVDEQFLEKPEIVTHIVIHEFIHFLTMHEQAKGDRIPDFMNEGITEKLAREVSGLKEGQKYNLHEEVVVDGDLDGYGEESETDDDVVLEDDESIDDENVK